MKKKKPIKVSKDELRNQMIDQLSLMRSACKSYDSGLEAMGKFISSNLRVLLHSSHFSKSLMQQLKIRNRSFYDSAGKLSKTNLLSECNLIILEMGSSEGRYIPLIAVSDPPYPPKLISFVDWWKNPVLKDQSGNHFSRKDLVLNVANTDGGAHVDPELEESYMAISRKNSLGWEFVSGDIVESFKGKPELACMRQIAHEVLLTIHDLYPEYSQYSIPVIPDKK